MLLRDLIRQRIRSAGPMRFAEYMELALYHPELGYYARSDQRSGRAGDFFTSVDVGPLYGELLSAQFAQMGEILRPGPAAKSGTIDLVEAAAGNGRLSRDILNAARHSFPAFYRALRLTLVERSETARATHDTTLRDHQSKREPSTATLPAPITGIVFANELLDALPVHPVVMGDSGLSEIYVDIVTPSDGRPVRFVERRGPPGDDVVQHIARFDIQIPPGARGEVCPAAVRWVESVGRNLERGFLVLVDYGHEAHELYSDTHATGNAHHLHAPRRSDGDGPSGSHPLAGRPGSQRHHGARGSQCHTSDGAGLGLRDISGHRPVVFLARARRDAPDGTS